MFGFGGKRHQMVQRYSSRGPSISATGMPEIRFNPYTGNHYEQKDYPGPGTLNYAYEGYALYEVTPIGPGVSVRAPINGVFLVPPIQVGQQLPTQGLGGVIHGTIYGAPLLSQQDLAYEFEAGS